jgi:hypothetical protein
MLCLPLSGAFSFVKLETVRSSAIEFGTMEYTVANHG